MKEGDDDLTMVEDSCEGLSSRALLFNGLSFYALLGFYGSLLAQFYIDRGCHYSS